MEGEFPDQASDAGVRDGRTGDADGEGGEEERRQGGEEGRVGVESVLAVEDGGCLGVGLFTGAEDVGADVRVVESGSWSGRGAMMWFFAICHT